MNFIELLDEYETRCTITRENIHEKLYEAPILHSYFSKHLYNWKRRLKTVEIEKLSLYRKKYYYYKNDYDHVLKDSEIKWHIQTDEEYMKIEKRFYNLKQEVEQIQEMTSFCSKISFYCQNIISYEQFINGVK